MKRVLKIELRKAICNKYFFFTLLVGILITLFSAGVQVETYQSYRELIDTKTVNAEGEYRKDPAIPGYSLYNNWVGGEASSVGHAAFYMLLPLLACIPASWSFCTERKTGYAGQMMLRCGKKKYLFSKYAGVFLSGFFVILLPMLVNFLTVALFIPARMPDPYYDIYYGMSRVSLMSWLFYTQPLLYAGFFMLLDAVFAGLFAVLALAFSYVVQNRFVLVLIPFAIAMLLHYLSTIFSAALGDTLGEISPIYFLSAINTHLDKFPLTIILLGLLLLAASAGATWKQGGKGDVF